MPEKTTVDELARRLHGEMWHLEPSEVPADEEWAGMGDGEREFYRLLVKFMMREISGIKRPDITV
jgi:hypothetical protein